MFRIGEFSKMSKITIKTLRYYDEEGLLKPAEIDKFTGYAVDLIEAMKARHSVRSFTERKIEGEIKEALQLQIKACSAESGLNIQLITDEPQAFDGFLTHYGKFKNCRNYIAIGGKKGVGEGVGYYGEKILLTAQSLGLNSCWVGISYRKSKVPCTLKKGEKCYILIALGYGETQGVPHKNKPMDMLCHVEGEMEPWFQRGMEGVLLAPTAMNQQKFMFSLIDGKLSAKAGIGFYTKVDLGIAKYHFDLCGGKEGDFISFGDALKKL